MHTNNFDITVFFFFLVMFLIHDQSLPVFVDDRTCRINWKT